MAASRLMPDMIVGILSLVIAAVILFFPFGQHKTAPTDLSEFSAISTICELATLKSYYHNVAIYEKEPGGGDRIVNAFVLWPVGSLARIGYKQFWLEYSGVVETGVDASQIRINGPDAAGVVEVYLPDARVLNVYADESSLSEPISETGWFTTISTKEKMETFSGAQRAMRQEAEQDQTLLRRAKSNAKLLLERYIVNTGKEIGAHYTVKWVESP